MQHHDQTAETDELEVFKAVARDILASYDDWLSFFDGKFYSIGFSLGFLKLFDAPGMKKSEVALFLENFAKVSRSTAERMLKEAEAAGHIIVQDRDEGEGTGKAIHLSPELFDHCMKYLSKRTIRAAESFSDLAPFVAKAEN